MKTSHYLKDTLRFAFVASSLFFASCTGDNSLLETTEEEIEEIDYSVTVNATNANSGERTANFKALVGSTVPVIVKFTKEKDDMDRLYVTQNISGSTEGSVAYDIDADDLLDLDTKLDGSLDLEGDQEDEFTFTINFPAPTTDNATVQYILWTTEGRGDYRDITNDNAFENKETYAVITITAGTAAELSAYKEFTATVLSAPLADGTSKTFVSLFDNKTHAINDGIETAALWDFGYFYGTTSKASLYSASAYSNTAFLNFFAKNGNTGLSVAEFSGATSTELNNFYFSKSTMTSTQFNAVNSNNDLDNIVTPTNESIDNLSVNDIIEFEDQYGNKGLIKVTNISGTTGNNGSITFDIKTQTNITPIAL